MTTNNQLTQQLADVLILPSAGRTLCLGRTGTGKSTLMDQLRIAYMIKYPRARILIIDSKPRYKAQWLTSGLSASKHYRKWSRGEYLAGSYRIDPELDIKRELQLIWSYKARIAIAQTTPGKIADLRWLQEVARVFYGEGSDKYPRLVDVDEISDFFEVQRMAGIFHQIARSGREMNVGLLAGSQRPRFIPSTILTECDRLYLFHLDNRKDVLSIQDMGLPKDIAVPHGHTFFYWNKITGWEHPSGQYYQLEVGSKTS